ncbi:diguanylate cyclase [bacterium]|nr:diguanylate cyclase [bacterium]
MAEQTLRVLYLEDDPAHARLLQRRLEREGMAVTLARDGRQGLALCATGHFDILVMDHDMPGMMGLDVLRALAAQGILPPTIMLTGSGDESVAVAAMKLGASDYVVKDVGANHLELLPAVIQQALDRQRLADDKRQAEQALRESECRFRELSTRDELTGLFNCRHFFPHAEAEIKRSQRHGRPLSLAFLDVDDFKNYNDTYGHVQGDRVLAALGATIRRGLRASDSGHRYGGEDFVVLLPETSEAEALAVTDRIRAAFACIRFHPAPGVAESRTLSAGVAQHEPGESLSCLVSRADACMYAAKARGKDQTCTAPQPQPV